jgi:hypothetical protein
MAPPKHARTAQVEGEIVLGRPVEEVFDYVADEFGGHYTACLSSFLRDRQRALP